MATRISTCLRSCLRVARSWWANLGKPIKEPPVETLLARAKKELLMYLLIATIFEAMIIYIKDIPCWHIMLFAVLVVCFGVVERWFYIMACRVSREAREKHQKAMHSALRRLFVFAAVLVVAAVIISQNVLGIGDVATAALPWTGPASQAVLEFTNGTVEEIMIIFSS